MIHLRASSDGVSWALPPATGSRPSSTVRNTPERAPAATALTIAKAELGPPSCALWPKAGLAAPLCPGEWDQPHEGCSVGPCPSRGPSRCPSRAGPGLALSAMGWRRLPTVGFSQKCVTATSQMRRSKLVAGLRSFVSFLQMLTVRRSWRYAAAPGSVGNQKEMRR